MSQQEISRDGGSVTIDWGLVYAELYEMDDDGEAEIYVQDYADGPSLRMEFEGDGKIAIEAGFDPVELMRQLEENFEVTVEAEQ